MNFTLTKMVLIAGLALAPLASAQAAERLNDGLLGAGAGALVGGPVGAVVGGAVGYTAGPHIGRGIDRVTDTGPSYRHRRHYRSSHYRRHRTYYR